MNLNYIMNEYLNYVLLIDEKEISKYKTIKIEGLNIEKKRIIILK